jgi:hypothetical protein
MSMAYAMILVPSEPQVRPALPCIAEFLGRALEMGLLGSQLKIFVRDYQKAVRTTRGRNPATGELFEHRAPVTTNIGSADEFPDALAGLAEFDAVLSGIGPARLLAIRNVGGYDRGQWKPLRGLVESGVFTEGYGVSVSCCQRARLVSTSNLHEETRCDRRVTPFGDPCELGDRVGRYSNPETMELIEVPDAGCSTFWITYQLGNWMFPNFSENRIDFAEPNMRQLAETTFGTKFKEGCRWG